MLYIYSVQNVAINLISTLNNCLTRSEMAELTCGCTADSEVLQLVTLFLALITVSKAGITVTHAAQYPAVPNKVQIAQ